MMHRRHRQLPWRLLLASTVSFGALDASAQSADATESSSVECISVTRITRTEVLDEQTILFHMRGQQTYGNYLPSECPGLDEQSRFTYETSTGKLCSNDTITLLERGHQLRLGITCRLGKFLPASAAASAEEVRDLTLDADSRRATPIATEIGRAELPPTAEANPPAPPASSANDVPPAPEEGAR
jgi:hypothetical protein